jgi:hypothetical protein
LQWSRAEFGADGVGYGVGVVAHEGFGFGFDHDAGEGFGAGVADDYAAGVAEGGFCGGDGGADGGDLVEGALFADVDVDDDLGEGFEVGGELGEGLAAAVDDVEEEERGEDAVAGGGAAGEDDVAGLFAAEGCAGGEHLLEDVLVADGGAEHLDLAALEGGFEAHVGHGGGDYGVVGEQVEGFEVAGGEEEDRVSVDDFAVFVGEEGSVGVSVEGDAHGGALGDDFGGDDGGVEGAAVLVDVAAVGRGVSEDDFAAAVFVEQGEELGGDGGGCSVGAVDYDAAAVEGETGNGIEEELDVLGAVGFVDGRRGRGGPIPGLRVETWGTRLCVERQMAEDFGLDGDFGGVRELEAVGTEKLDAVVLPGIVRGGDDNACGKVVRAGEEGDGGSGDDSGGFDGGATGREACGKGGGDPVRRLAGVLADEDAGRVAQVMGECEADGVDGGGVERGLAGDATNAVGAEKLLHRIISPYLLSGVPGETGESAFEGWGSGSGLRGAARRLLI